MSFDCTFIRLVLVWLLLSAVASATLAEDAVAPNVKQFVSTYCVGCHGQDKQEGDFRVDSLQVSRHAADAENWQLVIDKLLMGEMPPEKAKQPKPFEVESVTSWIRSEISRAAEQLKGTGGEIVLRRLNRAEYQNTIADLFDVHGDFTSGFPEDMRAHGYDNNGGALMLSASQMQEYMKAAEFVLARAIAPDKKPETKSVSFTLHDCNRDGFEAVRKNLKNRQENFKNLTPYEQQNTLKMEAEAKANPQSFGYRFPVFENGKFRVPTADDSAELDAVMTVQQYFSGEPNTSKRFPVRQPGWFRVLASGFGLKIVG